MTLRQTLATLLMVGLFLAGNPGGILLAEGEAPPVEVAATEAPAAPADTGENGDNGANGGEEVPSTPEEGDGAEGTPGDNGDTTSNPPAEVLTGDAFAGTDTQTEANTNDVTVETPEGDEGDVEAEGQIPPPPWILAPDNTSSTTIDIDNNGTASTSAYVAANTGLNNAGGNASSSAHIATGDAVAVANVINVVNTNIVNSYGFLLFLNQLFGAGTFDLRDLGIEDMMANGITNNGGSTCNFFVCAQPSMNVNINNTGDITNAVVVNANTGGNNATGDGSLIETGDAYAAANVVNLLNTNIVDSNYLLVSMNHFGDYGDDIVFPNMDFFSWFLNGTGISGFSETILNNDATVNNNVDATAHTGGNALDGEGGAIGTGDAYSSGGATNVVNTNALGGNSLYILVRVQGDWAGEVFNLPEGLAWEQTPEGVAIYSAGNGVGSGGLSTSITNKGTINNNISVTALTGENRIDGDGGLIHTGDAFAAANVFNMVNTNVIGRNWLYAAINIMGNWDGNFSFGRPDLWIGGRAESPDAQIRPGSPINYTFTVTNFGDAVAHDVKITNEDNTNLVFDDNTAWDIGTLAPGESREIKRRGRVPASLSFGEHPVITRTTARARESDNNMEDNTETLSLLAIEVPTGGGGGGGNGGGGSAGGTGAGGFFNTRRAGDLAPIVVTKTANVSELTAPGSVDYTVTITNEGPTVYKAVLVDKLLSAATGKPTKESAFEIGTIGAGETVLVKYTMTFNEKTVAGLYANMAQVGAATTDHPGTARMVYSPVAETSLTIHGAVVAERESFLDLCKQYITKYMRFGSFNDPKEVTKLQTFLKDTEGFTDLEVTGIFDLATRTAVQKFQERYAGEILTPWGIKNPTGYVYYTTQKKVNEIYCAYNMGFPLSDVQLKEMNAFKASVEKARSTGAPMPSTNEVGMKSRREPTQTATVTNTTQVANTSVIQEAVDTALENANKNSPAAAARALLRASTTQKELPKTGFPPDFLKKWFNNTFGGQNNRGAFIMGELFSTRY